MSVLVVDDEQMIRSLTENILTRVGYEVLLAESGEAGLKMFFENSAEIDLVIVDMSMEGLSGLDMLRAIRRINPAIPGIVSTGHAVDDADLPDDLAANTYLLQKPYRSTTLERMVQQALGVPEPVF